MDIIFKYTQDSDTKLYQASNFEFGIFLEHPSLPELFGLIGEVLELNIKGRLTLTKDVRPNLFVLYATEEGYKEWLGEHEMPPF